ncbi:MAG: PQQ-binding-like beta-propeller repeat protein, partial [Lentisphaeria bacterium]|nr:PQQ-binding-like beta-propeller repeat protein [Lentisphaeria bacterium]
GAIRRELPDTRGATDILVDDAGLVCCRVLDVDGRQETRIAELDRASGQKRWSRTVPRVQAPCFALGRNAVVYHEGGAVVCLNRQDGAESWRTPEPPLPAGQRRGGRMMLVTGDTVVLCDAKEIRALTLGNGVQRWAAPSGQGAMQATDLFAANGRVWHALAGGLIAGYDLATGALRETIDPRAVDSPGHHLRCYPAKATERYLITQFRGIEFISIQGETHSQNDWVRGPCTYGVMPANGLLYVPPHPCFCYGDAMMIAFNAYQTADERALAAIGVESQGGDLETGPAYARPPTAAHTDGDWPAYRHDPRRSGATPAAVAPGAGQRWRTVLGGRLTPPIAAMGMVYLAAKDEHAICALRLDTGELAWRYQADGPIDSPPAVDGDRLLFGSADGCLTCLEAATGTLAWRRRLAPEDRLMVSFGALESVWRVHGSPLIRDGMAYTMAGRSSFLDGGLFVYALDARTGEIRHRARYHTLSETREDAADGDLLPAFSIEGARSDILVAEGDRIYLNQTTFTPDLKILDSPYIPEPEVADTRTMDLDEAPYVDPGVFRINWRGTDYADTETQTSIGVKRGPMGERRTGLHLLTKSGFLDDSYYNRTYWMYASVWPGFQHAILAPKSGQLLVVGSDRTIAMKAYNARYVLSPKYTPGKGYLLVADRNDNEPVLDARSWGRDKGMGFTRAQPPLWHRWVPVRVRAMVLAGNTLFAAGPPDVIPEDDPTAAWRGRTDGRFLALSADSGETLGESVIPETPVFDGLIATRGCLLMVTEQGSVLCFGK